MASYKQNASGLLIPATIQSDGTALIDGADTSVSVISGKYNNVQPGDRVAVSRIQSRVMVVGSLDSGSDIGVIHSVGTAGEPAFQNGFHNYSAAYMGVNFYVEAGGDKVALEGLVQSSTQATGVALFFVLPAAYRPAKSYIFLTMGYATSLGGYYPARIDVASNGNVQCANYTTASSFISLSTCVFRRTP